MVVLHLGKKAWVANLCRYHIDYTYIWASNLSTQASKKSWLWKNIFFGWSFVLGINNEDKASQDYFHHIWYLSTKTAASIVPKKVLFLTIFLISHWLYTHQQFVYGLVIMFAKEIFMWHAYPLSTKASKNGSL